MPKILNDYNGIENYYKNEVVIDNLGLVKHMLLGLNLFCWFIVMLLLFYHVLPVYYCGYHIVPQFSGTLPSICNQEAFGHILFDI